MPPTFIAIKVISHYPYLIILTCFVFPNNCRVLAYLGPRKWSHLALWKFREFNELPEIFESRMNKAMEPTNKYLSIFRNPLLTIVGKCTSYISGAFVATLLFASLFEEGALLYVSNNRHKIFDSFSLALYHTLCVLCEGKNRRQKSSLVFGHIFCNICWSPVAYSR